MEWAQVLVIILSVFLALFLVLAIVLTLLLIKVTKQIRSITTTAEKATLKFAGAAESAAKFAAPAAIAKMMANFIKKSKDK